MTESCKQCGVPVKGSMSLGDAMKQHTPMYCHWCKNYFCSTCVRSDADCPNTTCDGVVTEESNAKSMSVYAGGTRFHERCAKDERQRSRSESKADKLWEKIEAKQKQAREESGNLRYMNASNKYRTALRLLDELEDLQRTGRISRIRSTSIEKKRAELQSAMEQAKAARQS